MERRAKIVATLGPSTDTASRVLRLLKAGVDVVRLNLSHGDQESHRRLIGWVRAAEKKLDCHIPILVDLMGPRYRLGTLDGKLLLKRNQRVVLPAPGEGVVDLPIDDNELLGHLQKGERVLIDNGLVELVVESKRDGRVRARVLQGGEVSTRKGINLPDTETPFKTSKKDRADIAFAVAEQVDYIAVSYVGSARDIEAVRRVARRHSKGKPVIPLIAKIERAAAIDRVDEIVAAANAVMVARGDLGVEVPLHRIPMLQKQIIAAGRSAGVPVIVATQMLESMMTLPRPTRAEATDVANAVLDGADALMLSGETAAGSHPFETVRTMNRFIVGAEGFRRDTLPTDETPLVESEVARRPDRPRAVSRRIADVVCASAVHAAGDLGSGPIVAFSQGGFTARSIARYRPAVPILVFTNSPKIARRIQLFWGVRPLLVDKQVDELEEVVETVDRELLGARLARRGQPIVLLLGDPIRDRPITNLMRIQIVGAAAKRAAKGRT